MKLNSYIIQVWLVLGLLFWIGAGQSLMGQITLPYMQGFETAGPTVTFDTAVTTSINGIPEWSYEKDNNDDGRLRFEAGAGFYNNGTKAATLDKSVSGGNDVINYLIGTLDLSNYAGSSDLELSFFYMDHGEEDDINDRVWIRGDTGLAWIEIYDLFDGSPVGGVYNFVSGLDIDSIMLANAQTITARFQIRFGQEDNFEATTPTGTDGFTFDDILITGSLPIPDNAGISSIDAPTTPTPPGMSSVDVTLFNFGTNNLDTVTIGWEVNGALQTPVTFTGPSLTPVTGTAVSLGMFNFTAGFNTIRAWSSMPNNNPDLDNGNDTAEVTVLFCDALAGPYTVGGPTADYPTLNDAVFALNNCGVGGAVTLNINPGTYNETIELGEIMGISSVNTVTFDGGNQMTTIISDSTPQVPIVYMNGADWITFQNVTIENRATFDSWGVFMQDTADNNTFESVRFQMPQIPFAFDIVGIAMSNSLFSSASSGNNANHTTISNCTFFGGYRGVTLQGTTSDFSEGNKVMNCFFDGQDDEGIWAFYQDSMDLIGNTIVPSPLTTFYDGMDISDCSNYKINENTITNNVGRGIELDNMNDRIVTLGRSEIINNMIIASTTGIDMFDVEETNFYHNSIVGTPGMLNNDYDDMSMINNILYSPGGKAIDLTDAVSSRTNIAITNNLYFTGGPDLADDGASTYPDLLAWLTASPLLNDGSLEGDPFFVDPASDLHAAGLLPFGAGDPTTGVLVDIDGDARPLPPALGVEIGADEYDIQPIDAGVTDLVSPASPFNAGLQTFAFSVRNFGLLTLDSVDIFYQINGATQPGHRYAVPIAAGSSAPNVVIPIQANVPAGTSTIKAWTTNPNGMADGNNSNDTLETTICTSLSGAYTIGGAAADFPDFRSAGADLNECGISGPVTFTVNAGTYNENLYLGVISGSSAANTITFDGGDSATTRLTFETPNDTATVWLQGTDWVTFQNITIENTGTTDAWCVQLSDTASNVSFDKVHFLTPIINFAFDIVGLSISDNPNSSAAAGQNARNTTVSNSTFTGGYRGVSAVGEFGNFASNLTISNSVFVGQDDEGVWAQNYDSVEVLNSTFNPSTFTTFYQGMDMTDVSNIRIIGNNVVSPQQGLDLDDVNDVTVPTQNSEIINNMFIGTNGVGMRMDDAEYINFYHNSFAGSTTGATFNDYEGCDIRNNIFYGVGFLAADFFDPDTSAIFPTPVTVDYNLYFSNGANLIGYGTTDYADLTALRLATNNVTNTNSVEGDPFFVDPATDLHLIGILANDAGDNTVGVATDIDGEVRPQAPSTTVDIGADEYTPLQFDALPLTIFSPATTYGCGDSNVSVIVEILNLGTDSLTNFPIDAIITGDFATVLSTFYTDTLAPFKRDTVLVGLLNTATGGTYDIEVATVLTGDQNIDNDTIARTNLQALPFVPEAIEDTVTVCEDSALVLANAQLGLDYAWFDSLNSMTPIALGDSFVIPSIAGQGTYYLGYFSNLDTAQLTTFPNFAGGNGQSGNMFDLTANNSSIVIDSMDIHIGGTGTETVELWFTDQPGGFDANAGNAAAWTLVGSETVIGQGVGVPTRIRNIPSLVVPAGQTYGIYVTLTTSTNIDYTNGNPGDFDDNGDIRLDYGFGVAYPFGTNFSVRIWNGTLYYSGLACSDTRIPVTAQNFPDPVAGLGVSDNLLSITIADSSVNADSVSYDYGDGSTGSSNTYSYAKPGTYTVCQIAYGECTNDTSCVSVTVSCPAAVAGFAIIEDTSTLIFVNSVATGAVDSIRYDWGDGTSTTVDSAGSSSHFYQTTGIYEVCQIAYSVCGNDTTCEMTDLLIRTGIEVPGVSTIEVYPNPNKGKFFLDLNINEMKDLKVKVTDVRGKIVYYKDYGQTIGQIKDAVELKNVGSGMYFVKMRFNDQEVNRKIRIE